MALSKIFQFQNQIQDDSQITGHQWFGTVTGPHNSNGGSSDSCLLGIAYGMVSLFFEVLTGVVASEVAKMSYR